MKVAIVIGATGVTGGPLTQYLLASESYKEVIVFSRRQLEFTHTKLVNHIVNFDHLEDWKSLVKGDDLFSAIGTTIKLAGSKEAQYKIDYTYQAEVARVANENGVERLFLVSSPGANASSKMFYTKMKGELDNYVASLSFSTLVYFKPSLINGDRPDRRVGERIGIISTNLLCGVIPGLSQWKPIKGHELARAIVNCAESPLSQGVHTFELGSIFELLKSYDS